MWLKLFFDVRKGTKEACRASCFGTLSDLAQTTSRCDRFIRDEVADSIKYFDPPPGSEAEPSPT